MQGVWSSQHSHVFPHHLHVSDYSAEVCSMEALLQLGDVASFQAHLGADGSNAYASSLARLVREAPLAADLAPYYERHIDVLLASVASLPAGCACPALRVSSGARITRPACKGLLHLALQGACAAHQGSGTSVHRSDQRAVAPAAALEECRRLAGARASARPLQAVMALLCEAWTGSSSLGPSADVGWQRAAVELVHAYPASRGAGSALGLLLLHAERAAEPRPRPARQRRRILCVRQADWLDLIVGGAPCSERKKGSGAC